MAEEVFDCHMCGICCEGKGGIVVSPKDLARLCAYLNMTPDSFRNEYGDMHNGKLHVRSGDDDNCVFFVSGEGCAVHESKPDICRAWPFFRGNMVDPESLHMAKEFCPGIRQDATHADFVAEGRKYLHDHGLEASDPRCEANALLSR